MNIKQWCRVPKTSVVQGFLSESTRRTPESLIWAHTDDDDDDDDDDNDDDNDDRIGWRHVEITSQPMLMMLMITMMMMITMAMTMIAFFKHFLTI